jgi:hypothetical protein
MHLPARAWVSRSADVIWFTPPRRRVDAAPNFDVSRAVRCREVADMDVLLAEAR